MRYEFEVMLSVSDYFEGMQESDFDHEAAFDACRDDLDEARAAAQSELADMLPIDRLSDIRIVSVDFVEFDSGNASHAGAAFNVVVDGDDDLIDMLKRVYQDE